MYVGIDLHKQYMQIAVIDEDGNAVSEGRVDNDPNNRALGRFLDELSLNARLVIESSNVWRKVFRFIRARGFCVVLSDPFKTKAIASAKIKTDKIDAMMLAQLLRAGLIPVSWVASEEIMDLRDLVRHRMCLGDMRRRMKVSIHAILLMDGIRIPGTPFTKKYVQELGALRNYRIDNYLAVIDSVNAAIRDADRRIRAAVRERDEKDARLLTSIPGISYYSALVIVSEIGDITRFADSHRLCSYAGLVPSTHSSGGRTRHGRITKRGSRYLRWILIECVQSNKRTSQDNDLMDFYRRVAARKGPAKATVAAASKLARMVYWVLKEQREFVPKMSDRRATRLATSQSRKAASNDLGVTAPLL